MSYTLVIIDMQEQFEASHEEKTIQNVIREIKKAYKDGAYIVLVEYDPAIYGYTNREITDLLSKAKGTVRTTWKYRDDGSREVINTINTYGFPQDFIRVCGVNTDACVARTVKGLDAKLNEYGFDGLTLDMRKDSTIIEIVWDACNTNSHYAIKSHDVTRHCSKNVIAVNVGTQGV